MFICFIISNFLLYKSYHNVGFKTRVFFVALQFKKGNSNNTNTPYFGGNKILNDRKTIDDSDGYRGGDFAGNTEQEHPNCIGEQFIDDEMSLFKNKNETLMASKHSDYRAFKTQLMQPNNQGNSGKENIVSG